MLLHAACQKGHVHGWGGSFVPGWVVQVVWVVWAVVGPRDRRKERRCEGGKNDWIDSANRSLAMALWSNAVRRSGPVPCPCPGPGRDPAPAPAPSSPSSPQFRCACTNPAWQATSTSTSDNGSRPPASPPDTPTRLILASINSTMADRGGWRGRSPSTCMSPEGRWGGADWVWVKRRK